MSVTSTKNDVTPIGKPSTCHKANSGLSTKDRILDEAMRLFSDQGYRGTSVAEIEAASGLSPGAGGLYHHFTSKDEVLAEGVARRISRLDTLQDRGPLLPNEGDLRSKLWASAGNYLRVLDSQTELLRLLATEARRRPDVLRGAVSRLIVDCYEDFAKWLAEESGRESNDPKVRAAASIGLGSLLASRLTRDLLDCSPLDVDDTDLLNSWTNLIMQALGDGILASSPEPPDSVSPSEL